jgi:hypothetical protein
MSIRSEEQMSWGKSWLRGTALALLCGTAILVSGCVDEPAWRPVRGPVPEGCGCSLDHGEPAFDGVPVYPIQVGAKVPISGGTKLGYVLVATGPGSYRFRWTGDTVVTGHGFRKFHGSVWTAGHFTSLVPGCDDGSCALEDMGDYVSGVQSMPGGGERIDWVTMAADGWDGFSFTTDTEPVFFDVNIEGAPRPDTFVFPTAASGGASVTPASNPFGILSQSPRAYVAR